MCTIHYNFLLSLPLFISALYKPIPEDEKINSGRHVMLGPCFVQLSLCFLAWSQASEQICETFIDSKFLIDYIWILKGSHLTQDTRVSHCKRTYC